MSLTLCLGVSSLHFLTLPFQPKSICPPQESPSQGEDDGGGTIKRCPVPESPARTTSSNVPPRPPPPRLPPHRRSSLGNESTQSQAGSEPEGNDDGSFRHFWEWLHAPHTEEELEEVLDVLEEVDESKAGQLVAP